jgi:hypothetical protein
MDRYALQQQALQMSSEEAGGQKLARQMLVDVDSYVCSGV